MLKILAAAFLAALLSGCAGNVVVSPGYLTGTRWAAPGAATPTLEFVGDSQVRGAGGCNTYLGKVAIHLDTLRFGPLAATQKMCDATAMQNEGRFFSALERTRWSRMAYGELMLVDATGTELLRLAPAK